MIDNVLYHLLTNILPSETNEAIFFPETENLKTITWIKLSAWKKKMKINKEGENIY